MPTLGFLKKKKTREGQDPSSNSQPNSPITPTTSRGFDQQQSLTATVTNQSTKTEADATSGEKQPMTSTLESQPYLAAGVAPPNPTPSPGTDAQNLPAISNLINPPQQNDGAPQSQPVTSAFAPPPAPANGAAAPAQAPAAQPLSGNMPHHAAPQQAAAAQYGGSRVTKGKYTLVDFELQRTLGTGSFGRVHLVQSRHNQRFYAIKVLKKAQVVKMKQVEHTNDERKMLGEVKHPFLITLWGTFQDSKNLYMVMDFVEGGELFSLLRKSGVSLST
jgi:protein kinase A